MIGRKEVSLQSGLKVKFLFETTGKINFGIRDSEDEYNTVIMPQKQYKLNRCSWLESE